MKIRYLLQHGFQLLLTLLSKLLFGLFTRRDYSGVPAGSMTRRGYLLVANHRMASDPFVITGLLPWRTLINVLPIGFMTHNAFYDSPLRPLMWLMGCYPARNPEEKHKIFGVEGSVTLLQNGFSIFIFPEGTRVRGQVRGEAHYGVIKIHNAAPEVPMLLAHIEHNRGLGGWLKGNRYVIRYKLIENPKFDNPESIMDEIFAL
jgi:1-acyl-sn-glycerol-3-phosphate acyltransferase